MMLIILQDGYTPVDVAEDDETRNVIRRAHVSMRAVCLFHLVRRTREMTSLDHMCIVQAERQRRRQQEEEAAAAEVCM